MKEEALEEEQAQIVLGVYKAITDVLDTHITEDDPTKESEMNFIISLVLSLLINRPFCLNCFMTRLMEAINDA